MSGKKFDLDSIIERVQKGEEPLEDIKAEVDAELKSVLPEEMLRGHQIVHHPDFHKFLEVPNSEEPN